jgi:hypothetical protein
MGGSWLASTAKEEEEPEGRRAAETDIERKSAEASTAGT